MFGGAGRRPLIGGGVHRLRGLCQVWGSLGRNDNAMVRTSYRVSVSRYSSSNEISPLTSSFMGRLRLAGERRVEIFLKRVEVYAR